jgi:hypothetical protein
MLVNIDLSAPTTSATIAGTAGSNGWMRSSVSVTLQGTDTISGIASTTYKLDGGTTQPATGPIAVDTEGRHTLFFSSRDRAGHAEALQTREINIDSGAPTLLTTATPAIVKSGTGSASILVTGRASDGVSGLDTTGLTSSWSTSTAAQSLWAPTRWALRAPTPSA